MDEVRPSPRILALSLVGLAFFLAWQALALRSFTRIETRPPAWDQAIHLEIALDYRNAIQAGNWSEVMHLAPKSGMPPFPPLYHLLLRYAYASPDPANAGLWLNWFYLAVLCVALFGLAWHFRPDETALLCVVIFAGSPAVLDLLQTQLVDLALVALAAAAYWALVRSEGFQRWPGSLAFGVLFAAGMLHKWSFFSYFIPVAYPALQALSRPQRLPKLLAAALVALAGFLPWYWIHLSVLVPRLFQASADFAVPFWKGTAALNYLAQMADGLGPLFCALSVIGLCVPQYKRNWHQGWLLVAWFICSYLFWMLVPNRQLRFLLPGLPALAVAGLGAWPKGVLWGLAALQLFTMANFSSGWVQPISIPLPLRRLTLLPSQPPVREDWKIAEILTTAEKNADPDLPLANLTLIANDTRFNGPNFAWTAKLLELPRVRVRGVNRRLCEFSQFVVLKDARLGPAGVIGGLPEASEIVKQSKNWFAQGYEQIGKWPLPDGSSAVLYRQRRFTKPPFTFRKLGFQFFSAGEFEAENLLIELGDWDAKRSAYRWAKVSASEIKLRGLRMTDALVEIDGFMVVPIHSGDPNNWEDLRFLKMDRLTVRSLRAEGADLRAFIESRAKGLRLTQFDLDKTLKVRGLVKGLTFSAELAAQVLTSPPGLRLDLRDARIGVTPVPDALLGPLRTFVQPFTPTPELPFIIGLAGLTMADGRLTVP